GRRCVRANDEPRGAGGRKEARGRAARGGDVVAHHGSRNRVHPHDGRRPLRRGGGEEERGGKRHEDEDAEKGRHGHRVSAYTMTFTPKRVLSTARKRLFRAW